MNKKKKKSLYLREMQIQSKSEFISTVKRKAFLTTFP